LDTLFKNNRYWQFFVLHFDIDVVIFLLQRHNTTRGGLFFGRNSDYPVARLHRVKSSK
jgi:hypothetical protein